MNVNTLSRPLLKPAIVAALVLAAVALGGGVRHAATASAAQPYKIAVTFQSIYFPAINDGCWDGCDYGAELYGWFRGEATTSGTITSSGIRNLSAWGAESPWCPTDGVVWSNSSYQNATCFHQAAQGMTVYPSQAFLCTTVSLYSCTGPYAKNNNTIVLSVLPGQWIGLDTNLLDYDALSADDTICAVSKFLGPFSAAQLSTLNLSGQVAQSFNGDGSCIVSYTVTRVG